MFCRGGGVIINVFVEFDKVVGIFVIRDMIYV